MSVIQVFGLTPLEGEISIQGSKNAVLPMCSGPCLQRYYSSVSPGHPGDVATWVDILEYLGARCCHKGDCLVIDARHITGPVFRGKVCNGHAFLYCGAQRAAGTDGRRKEHCYPGGCLIGARPIDLHLMALQALGAEIKEHDGLIEARCRNGQGLKGTEIHLPYPSVGATEQAILASVLAKEVTVIHGAAKEPEISQLCRFLNNMGAVICGMGTDHLMIQGVEELHDSSFRVEGDRIVAGTYAAAVMAAMGSITLKEVRAAELELPLEMLKRSGASIQKDSCCRQIRIEMKKRPLPGYKDWSISGIPHGPSVPVHGISGIRTGNQHHCGAGV